MTEFNVKDTLTDPGESARFFALCGYEKPAIIRYLMGRLNIPQDRAEALAGDAVKAQQEGGPDGETQSA